MRKILLFTLFAISFLGAKAQTYYWSGNDSIQDFQRDSIPILVSGLPSVIDTSFGLAHICFNINHSYDADLVIKLVAPNGDSVLLVQNIGGSGDGFLGTCVGMDGTFFSNSTAPYGGIFVPVGDVSVLNNGMNPNGTWYLLVSDVAANDVGNITTASLAFTNNPPQLINTGGGTITGTYVCATCVCPGSATSCDLLPDMTASAKEIELNHTETPGALYISNATPNIGYGPLEIYGIDTCFCGTTQVPCGTVCPPGEELTQVIKQRIYQKVAGTDSLDFYDRLAGHMEYHPNHGHLHVDDFASYTLRTATSNPDATTWPIVGTGVKQSFCLINLGTCPGNPGQCRDNLGNIITTLPNQNLGFHTGCGFTQGIYVGNYDVYSISLNDPIPLNNVCNGTYYVVSITDPEDNFLESDETNNWVAVPITLTQQNVTPVITASGPTSFCNGDSVILTCNIASNYLWSTGATTQSIVVHTSGVYTVSTNCGTSTVTSNSVTVNVLTGTSSPTITITIAQGTNPTCAGASLSFQASVTNEGNNPYYQWRINGVDVGSNSSTFTTAAISNNDIVTCALTSNLACASPTNVLSNAITMNVTSALCYCLPIYGTTANSGCLDGDLIARIQLNTLDNNTGTTCPSGIAGYSNFSASTNPTHSTFLQEGNTYTCTVYPGQYAEGYKVWIDFNDDGQFSTSETIGYSTGTIAGSGVVGLVGNPGNFLVNIPCNAPIGPHRLRIRCSYNNSGINIDPCAYMNNYGEAEDYTVTIVTSIGCNAPSAISVTSITSTNAQINWALGCSDTIWNVHIGLVGSALATSNPSHPNIYNPLFVNGLLPNTAYSVWVQAKCSFGPVSSWAGPINFTTLSSCSNTVGSTMSNPISIGQIPCYNASYTDTKTNNAASCFTNTYSGANNQSSPDIWYHFNLQDSATVEISHCASNFDTYLHLLNASGNQIIGIDDNGPSCQGLQASITANLSAGTYYIVCEGYSNNEGAITTTVRTTDSCPPFASLQVKAFLQGYWNGVNAMQPVLFNQGQSGNSNVTDSLTVELHSKQAPYTIMYSTKGVITTNGIIELQYPLVFESFYIVVKHRNVLQTWSANPVQISHIPKLYDFSSSSSQAYGNNQIQVAPNTWAFYSGDINQDENIDLVDAPIVEADISNFANGYFATDITGDGNVDLLDSAPLELNISNFIFSVHP